MRTLLLADDNVTVQRVIALMFAQEPVRVLTASDGHQAMDRVVVDRPDIVLVGTTLPQVNGYELARFVKSKAELRNVPVLLLSGAFETVDEAQLESSGANGVIEKPVEPTTVINRVRQLLGIKSEGGTAAPTARLVTPAGVSPDQRPPAPVPTMPPAVTSTRPMPPPEPRGQAPDTADTDDYLESLQSAFDTLDQQLAGRVPAARADQRNPSPPPGRVASGDPRPPGKRPPVEAARRGDPVYEVDVDWFLPGAVPEDARAGRRELAEDVHAPELQAQAWAPPAQRVDSAGDEWFADDQRAGEAREIERRQLAAEMGIHEVTIPEPTVPKVAEVSEVPEVAQVPEVAAVPTGTPTPAPAASDRDGSLAIEPVARTLPIDWFELGGGSKASRQQEPGSVERVAVARHESLVVEVPTVAPIASTVSARDGAPPPRRIADDFAALLAFEQGEKAVPPMIEPIIHAVTPEITPEMLEQIAITVADRLKRTIQVEPQAPDITGEMLKTIAFLVSGQLRDQIRVEPAAPVITDAIVEQLSAMVAERLAERVRIEPKAPEITDAMLNHVAHHVSDRVQALMPAPPPPPQITDEMLDRVAARVADRVQGTFSIDGLRDSISGAIRDTVRAVVSETSERLVREEIERIKAKASNQG